MGARISLRSWCVTRPAALLPKRLHLSQALCSPHSREENMTTEADGCLHSTRVTIGQGGTAMPETGASCCVMLQACKQWVPVSERTLWESVDFPPWTGLQQTLPTPTAVSGTSSRWQDTHKDHRKRRHFCNLILISEWSQMPVHGLDCNVSGWQVSTVQVLACLYPLQACVRCMLVHRTLREPLMQTPDILS